MKYYNEEIENRKAELKDKILNKIEAELEKEEIEIKKLIMFTQLMEILEK